MLVLTRRINESLLIGEARITIVRSRGGVVRLGIEAPRGCPILREELLDRWRIAEPADGSADGSASGSAEELAAATAEGAA